MLAVTIPVAVGAVLKIASAPPDAGLALFFVAALAAEYKPVPLDEQGGRTVSLAFVFLLSTQFLFGWQYAVLGAIISMVIVQVHNRAPAVRTMFNGASSGLSAFVSAGPGFILGWTVSPHHAGALTALVFMGGAAYVVTNVITVAIAGSLYTGIGMREMLEDYVRHSGPPFAIMAFIAALATSLWMINPRLELLLAGPLFALALYQRYAYRSVVATRDAETDALTGLRNHRSFQTDLREALALGASTRSLMGLVLIDIDNFKSINDRFGHLVGDDVLIALARLMREEYGDAQAYRIGGEEFALLLPDDGDQLLRVADGALDWAKNHGKNRSCVYSPTVVRIYTPDELAESAERHARLKAAEGLIRVVDAKDTYAGAHSQSVSRLVEGIARAMGLDEETVEQVRLAGLLHDLGKIAIPDRILQKPGKLDPDELRIMREHADLGYRLLEGLGVSPVDRWIRHPHERWDDSGYPLGLAGEDIPLGSRIILVADAFDAMTSDRVYRAAGTAADAVAELRRRCWTQFDARVV